jgi:hypothetical protein
MSDASPMDPAAIKKYEEQARFEFEGKSIGIHIDEIWWEPDCSDDGAIHYDACANVIINTDTQQPITEAELDEWGDDINDFIREVARHGDY